MLPALRLARERVKTILCVSNEKQLLSGVYVYGNDNCGFAPGTYYFYKKYNNGGYYHSLQVFQYGAPFLASGSKAVKADRSAFGYNQTMCQYGYWTLPLLMCPGSPEIYPGQPNVALNIKLPSKFETDDVTSLVGSQVKYVAVAYRLRTSNETGIYNSSGLMLGKNPRKAMLYDAFNTRDFSHEYGWTKIPESTTNVYNNADYYNYHGLRGKFYSGGIRPNFTIVVGFEDGSVSTDDIKTRMGYPGRNTMSEAYDYLTPSSSNYWRTKYR